ncbi:hypothetical protein JCM6882_000360 [Rhodosporidiobolus microsporus]
MASLARSPFSSPAPLKSRTPFAPLSRTHSRTPSTALALPPSSSMNGGVMSTPRSSSALHLQPYVHASAGSSSAASASPGASFGSSDSEDDDDDDERDGVPPTPGNDEDRFALFARQAGIKVAAPTPVRAALKGVELSRYFDGGKDGDDKLLIGGGGGGGEVSHPADQLLSPNAKSFFPSFGDFLPSIKQDEEERRKDIAAFSWSPSAANEDDNKENNDLDALAQRTAAFSLSHHRHERKQSFDPHPCGPFALGSPETDDSFTFFPSPGFRSSDGGSTASTKPTSTSSSLLSPKLEQRTASTFRAPAAQQVLHHHHHHSLSLPHSHQHHQHQHQHVSLPGFPATPPRTPVRSSFSSTVTSSEPSSLPYLQHPHAHQHQQQARVASAVPHPHPHALAAGGYFAVSVSLPPTPTSARAPIPVPAGYYAVPLSLAPPAVVPIAVSPAPPSSSHAHAHGGSEAPYPLSPADTDRIAKLHNGRVPSLQQLAPPEAMGVGSGGQPPIVNTGNQGQMVVQAGDWRCGVCSFVNWRRRKICLRCFPYANDIGNILTIQSQRAAYLAQPSPSRSSTFPSSVPSTATFHIQPALPAYSASSSSGGAPSDAGVPSAHLAAAAMARSATYPPSSGGGGGGYGSLALLEQYGYGGRYPSPASASVGQQQQQQRGYSHSHAHSHSLSGTPAPRSSYPAANVAPQQPHHHPQVYQQQQHPSPLPAVIWSTHEDPHGGGNGVSPPSSSSAGGLSATSAGEHHAAALLKAKQHAAAAGAGGGRKSEREVRVFPALSALEGEQQGEDREREGDGDGDDGGWGRAARSGYVAPGSPSRGVVMAEL